MRGIRLDGDDEVIAMAMLRHTGASPAEARAYLRQVRSMRAALDGVPPEIGDETAELDGVEESGDEIVLSPEQYADLGAREQFVLAVSENGFGKRSSSYEYRTAGRGGKGIIAMTVTPRNGRLVAAFPVEDADQIMLVTDGGQLIRCPVDDVRIAGRATQGVTIFRTAEDEHVVSVEHIADAGASGEPGEDAAGPLDGNGGDS